MNPITDTLPAEPTTEDSTDLLNNLFRPRSVALVGASNDPRKLITYRPIDYMKRYGYKGSIYPVNPKYDAVQDLRAYRSISELPESPELVVVALPRQHVLAALEDSVAAGAKVAIIYSSGFAEMDDGSDLQEELTELSRRTGLRIIGPNCQGIANLETGFFPSFSTTFSAEAPRSGRTAIVSQSGAVAGMLYNKWNAVGGGAKYWASTGNESDLTVAEIALAVIEDPEVDQVLLYAESLRSLPLWTRLAERSEELGKSVIAYRPVNSTRGWAAAGRHTGAGTNPSDHLSVRIPTGPGLIAAHSLEHMIDLAQLVRTRKTLGGRRLGVISNSGGLGVMTAETAVESGFSLDDLSLENRSRLSSILPSFASVMNPVDVTAQLLNDPLLMAKALPVMFEDEGVDAIVVSLGAVGDGYDIDQILEDVVTAHQSSDKIFLLVWVGSRIDVREDIGRQGVPIYESVTDALEALRDYADLQLGVQNIERAEGPQTPAFNHLFIGATYKSSPLTLDESAVNAYADAAKQLGDDGNVHVSIDAAIAAGHEGRVVSGLHTLTQLTIAGERLGLWEHSKAVAGFKDVRFLTPVIEGQEVAVTFTVTGLKPLKDTGSGLVTFDFEVSRTGDEAGRPAAVGEVTYVFHGAKE